MKKVFYTLVVMFIIGLSFSSCEVNDINENETETKFSFTIEPEEECPENDRNCNGIPDDEE